MKDNTSLKDKTIRNMIWSFIDNIGSRVIQLMIQLILARLLTPSDFGILGMVFIFIILSEVIIDSGFSNALIRDRATTQEDYSTVFYYNITIALSFYVLLYFTAGYISNFFEAPQLVSVLRVMGLVLFFDAIGLVQRTMLTKKLQMNIQMKINVTSSVVSGAIAIACALAGYGIWSLVVKILVLQSLQSISYTLSNRWKPSLVFSLNSFIRLFNFGWKLLASRLLTELYENLYAIIIGRGFSTASLGFYTNAKKLSITITYTIATSVEKVSYPVLSNLQDDNGRLKNGFQRILKNSAFISFPAVLGLAAISPALFRIVLGDNWVPSIPYFQILSLSGMFISINMINLNILQVKGRSDLYLRVNVLEKAFGFLIVGVILILRLGIFGLLWGLVMHSVIAYFINASYSKIMIGYSITEQIRDILTVSGISGVMASIMFLMNYVFSGNDWFLLVSQILVGLSVYFSLSYLFKLEELQTIYQIVKPLHRNLFARKVI